MKDVNREAPLEAASFQTAAEIAKAMALMIGRDLFHIHRGVTDVEIEYEGDLIDDKGRIHDAIACVCVFGNDGFLLDHRSRLQVDLLRRALVERGIEELGFGVSSNDSTWAMVLADPEGELREELEAMVWSAWFEACDLNVALAQQTTLAEPQQQGDGTDAD